LQTKPEEAPSAQGGELRCSLRARIECLGHHDDTDNDGQHHAGNEPRTRAGLVEPVIVAALAQILVRDCLVIRQAGLQRLANRLDVATGRDACERVGRLLRLSADQRAGGLKSKEKYTVAS